MGIETGIKSKQQTVNTIKQQLAKAIRILRDAPIDSLRGSLAATGEDGIVKLDADFCKAAMLTWNMIDYLQDAAINRGSREIAPNQLKSAVQFIAQSNPEDLLEATMGAVEDGSINHADLMEAMLKRRRDGGCVLRRLF
jgi:hypothetical protein